MIGRGTPNNQSKIPRPMMFPLKLKQFSDFERARGIPCRAASVPALACRRYPKFPRFAVGGFRPVSARLRGIEAFRDGIACSER